MNTRLDSPELHRESNLSPVDRARTASTRLAQHLAGWFNPDGGIHAPCRSRVLESALAYVLLRRYPGRTDALAGVRAYLAAVRSTTAATPLDTVLASAVLDTTTPGDPSIAAAMMSRFDHFTAGRKRVLLDTVLYLAGVTASVAPVPVELFDARSEQVWKQVEMTACKAIHAHATGRPGLIGTGELRMLAALQNPHKIWEGNILVHLLVLSALSLYPDHDTPTRSGLTALLAHQRPDGGFTLCPDMNTTITAIAGTAIAEAHAEPLLLRRLTDWLATRQAGNGGWTYSTCTTQTDVETTAFVMEALLLDDPQRHTTHLARGYDYLARMQNPDGGVPNYEPGNPSETSITGETATILSTQHPYHDHVERAVRFIVDHQHDDGSYALNWSASDANVILRTSHGMQDAITRSCLTNATEHAARRAITRSAEFLLGRQNPDGGWGQLPRNPSDPTSTSFALTTLGMTTRPAAPPTMANQIAAGLTYLCDQQDPDGGYASPPDTYSPRPLLIDFAPLPDAYALRALNHASRALGRLTTS